MRGFQLSDVGPAVRKLNPKLFARAGDEVPPVTASGAGDKESDLQAECESALSAKGYLRLTPANAEAYAHVRVPGWFGHMVHAVRNPFMPDLFVYAKGRPPLLVELKVRNRFGQGQREMIDAEWWMLATSIEQFRAILEQWEHP